MSQDTSNKVQKLITDTLNHYPDLFSYLDQIITSEFAFDIFKQIADVPAPSLTVRYTRTPIVQHIIKTAQDKKLCNKQLTFEPNYLRSGNAALILGQTPRKPIWLIAHLDNISFLTGEFQEGHYPLTPFCEARQTAGIRDAIALGYDLNRGTLSQIATGKLHSTEHGHFFKTDITNLPPATRVVYASQATWDQASGTVYGTIDDAFGCTALILAGIVLSHYPVEALLLLTDEEEGVVATGNQAFARGSGRLINRINYEQFPDLTIITDLHEVDYAIDKSQFGQGCLFSAFASNTKGGVTPPQILSFQRELSRYLETQNISLRENTGYISRSDGISAMLATPNIALIGYPGAYSHFIDTPRAHIDDLVNLAKTLTIYTLIVQSEVWQEQYLFG